VETWRRIVSRLPADWFPVETHPILTQYCRLISRASDISKMIDVAKREKSHAMYQKLLKDEQSLSRAISNLAVRLRITQSSTRRQDYTKRPVKESEDFDLTDDFG